MGRLHGAFPLSESPPEERNDGPKGLGPVPSAGTGSPPGAVCPFQEFLLQVGEDEEAVVGVAEETDEKPPGGWRHRR
jgi:hypothetical protein